ncbi:MAG: phenylalanine--tRNA ligase subunit beta [Anaerolineales bacterium]
MKVPVSWLRDFVDIDLSVEALAHRLTIAGLEVEEIHYVGLPMETSATGTHVTKITGLSWDPKKFVVGEILEVMPHPNADRLVLLRLDDGQGERIVLTGAPNLFAYKGQGPLEQPLKAAFAKEGAVLYDGHKPGWELTTLKPAKIRGVVSDSMVCSEKELGISEEHEGIIILDDDAPTGMPLVDYMGDAVLEIAITPNIARDANIFGVAREIAALTGMPLRHPDLTVDWQGPDMAAKAKIEIRKPELNPRFVLGLVENIEIKPSPYWAQRRLRLAGMRPINNIVDATNYAMLELGEPLHAFDYEVLVARAAGQAPTIITRTAHPGEKLTTLDDVERKLDDFTVLVCDTAGSLSIGGIMGGLESEVSRQTTNVLLEGAAWNFINVRRTLVSQGMSSEAAYRFSRGVHPAMAARGVRRGLQLMHAWGGGVVARGLVDNYPLPPEDPLVTFTPADVHRWLGVELDPEEIADLLRPLEFEVQVDSYMLHVRAPDSRLDIGTGIIGKADLMEEIARIYGYDRIPETHLADPLPPQRGNPALEHEERLRDLLTGQGLQEVITHRLTNPEKESRILPPASSSDLPEYLHIFNPISSDRNVLRRSLLASVLDIVERNARIRARQALFEIAPIFLPTGGQSLPDEQARLVIALTGPRAVPGWQAQDAQPMDFYDLKGVLEAVLRGLHITEISYTPAEDATFHPGKSAVLHIAGRPAGVLGELHPLVQQNFDFNDAPVLACDLSLAALLEALPDRYAVTPVPAFPPVLEDLAVVVDEALPAEQVAQVIRRAGGQMLVDLQLFDLYRGEQLGPDKKSLAYSLTYQVADRTLTDEEVARIRKAIIRSLEQELGAQLRT